MISTRCLPGFLGVYKHCITADVIGSWKTILVPRIHLRLRDPTVPLKLCRRRFLIKIAFAVTISKLESRPLYMLECIHYRLFLPMASCMWLLLDPLHFTTSLLQLLKGVDSMQKVIRFIVVYRGAIETFPRINKSSLIKYLLFTRANYWHRYNCYKNNFLLLT